MAELIYLMIVMLIVVVTAFSVGLGSSRAAQQAVQAINMQPAAQAEISKATTLGLALTETTAVLGLALGLYLVLRPLAPTADPFYGALAHLALLLALGLPGFVAGYVSAAPLGAAAYAVARQPFTTGKIINLLLITLSFVQTPVILGFVISAWAHLQAASCTSFPSALKIIAAGLAIGLGSVGPIIGLAHFARGANQAIGMNRTLYSKIFSFTFISAALIETPFIFALIIAIVILQHPATLTNLQSWACLAGAIAVGLSNLMPGLSSGRTATAACLELAKQPELYAQLSKTSIVVQSFIDSLALYGWIVALLLVMVA